MEPTDKKCIELHRDALLQTDIYNVEEATYVFEQIVSYFDTKNAREVISTTLDITMALVIIGLGIVAFLQGIHGLTKCYNNFHNKRLH